MKFLLKNELVFFFRGSALQVFGQCGGAKCGRGKAKLFLREEKDLLCLDSFCFWTGFPAAQEGAGGMRGGFFEANPKVLPKVIAYAKVVLD